MHPTTRSDRNQVPPDARGVILCAVAFAVACAAVADARGDERTAELVENVRANERLYENLELVLERDFKWVGPTDDPLYTSKELEAIIDEQAEGRWVYQDGKVYNRQDQTGATTASKYKHNYVLGYDGDKTRVVNESDGKRATANVHHGWPQRGRSMLAPHTLLMFREVEGSIPFSSLLAGKPFPRATKVRAVYEGEEELEGLHCIRVRCECWFGEDQPEPDRLQFWIAMERNYIPVREEVYLEDYSKTIPVAVMTVGDFRELVPGIWMPYRQTYVKNDEIAAMEGRTVVLSRHELTVKKADLNPDYDISLFRDIPIPPGARVHELVDGEIVRTYKQPDDRSGRRGLWFWIIVALAALAAVVSVRITLQRLQGGDRSVA